MTPFRFDRREWSGAFGDLGTDLPLLVGVTLACGLDAHRVFILFGVLQILSAYAYRLPVPVQPLKLVAALVITTSPPASVLWGAGLSIALVMLTLSLVGGLGALARLVPPSVVRGLQFGLGIQLAILALGTYVTSWGFSGYLLAALCFLTALILKQGQRLPTGLAIVGLGLLWSLAFGPPESAVMTSGLPPTGLTWPTLANLMAGFFLLALPQLPLSLGNSVLATRQILEDCFPKTAPSPKKIGLTYSIFNGISAMLGGIPVCHGSGGVAGHVALGARTGGSVLIYGAFMVTLGLILGHRVEVIEQLFPLPMLGVLLFLEAVTLIVIALPILSLQHRSESENTSITLITGLMAVGLPYGFLVGMLVGTALFWSRLLSDRSQVESEETPHR